MAELAITGVSGRLGRHVFARLRDTGHDVVGQSNRSARAFDDFFARERPRCLVHLAGLTPHASTDQSDEAHMAANFGFARSVCDTAWAHGVRTFVLASTSAVYGIPDPGEDLAESSPCRPTTAYGRAKLAMERWATQDLAARPGSSVTCLRIGNVGGADAWLANVFARYRGETDDLVLGRFPVDTAEDPSPLRSYIAATDVGSVIDGLLGLRDAGTTLPPVVNVGGARPVSLLALLRSFERSLETTVPFRWQEARDPTTARIVLDTNLLHSLVPVPPEKSGPDYLARAASDQFL